MTCKTYIELKVECLYDFDHDEAVLQGVCIVAPDKSLGPEIKPQLSKNQIQVLLMDCKADWRNKLKEEE